MHVYHYDPTTGRYRGDSEARLDPREHTPLVPAHATLQDPPEAGDGAYAAWDVQAGAWTIRQEDTAGARRVEILAELAAIDVASARPLRGVLAKQAAGGTPDQTDTDRLVALEAQAQALRAELAGLAE